MYSIAMPKKLIVGSGTIDQIPTLFKDVKNVLLVTDKGIKSTSLLEKPLELLNSNAESVTIVDDIPAEPQTAQLDVIFDKIKSKNIDGIVAIGGGSVMDSAKLFSALLVDNPSIKELINGATIKNKGVPTLMIPTTAGTGSEATQNVIVAVTDENRKVGIISELLIPEYVILDPEMTKTLPKGMTGSTGIDALCHSIECFFSKKGNPICDMLALKSLGLIFKSLKTAFFEPDNLKAREDMLMASYYGGMCIATSGTTAVHALSYPLGAIYHVPHGVSNAIFLTPVLKFNKDAIIPHLVQVADVIPLKTAGKSEEQLAEDVILEIEKLVRAVEIPETMAQLGLESVNIDDLVEGAAKVTRLLDNNPKEMSKEDIRKIYESVV